MASKSGKQKNLTKEEELLLQDFSRNVSTKSSALFYGNALIVSAIPMCKCILIDINFPHVCSLLPRRHYFKWVEYAFPSPEIRPGPWVLYLMLERNANEDKTFADKTPDS